MTVKEPTLTSSADDWLVYADQLQSKGDARGELIALNHAVAKGGPAAARDAYVKSHAEQVLGAAGKFVDAYELTWRWMTLESAKVTARSTEQAPALNALLDSPASADLASLVLAGDAQTESDKMDLSSAVARIARGLPATCRALSLIDARAARSTSVIATFYDPPANLVDFGELGGLWPALAKIEKLHFSTSDAAQLQLGQIAAPALTHFRIDCLTWGGSESISESLDEASWPNLKVLELRLPEHWTFSIPDDVNGYTRPYDGREDDEDYYGDDDGYHEPLDWGRRLRPLLESLKKTKLERLALTSFSSPQNVIEALDEAGLPETTRELDLSDSSIDGSAVELLANASFAKRLKRVVLERTPVSADELAPLRALGIDVVHSEGGGATYRFLVGME